MVETEEIIKEADGSLVGVGTLGFEVVTKTLREAMTSVEGIVAALEEASAVIDSCRIGDFEVTIPVEEEDLGWDLHQTMVSQVVTTAKT